MYMKLLLFFVLSCLFIHFGRKYVPKTLTNNKKLIYGVTAGLFLCSLFGGQLVEGFDDTCFEGQILNKDKTECIDCQAGQGPNVNKTECIPCTEGKVSKVGERGNFGGCFECSGPFVPNTEKTDCVACPADQITNEGQCEICPTVTSGAGGKALGWEDVQMIPDKSGSWPPSKCDCPPGHIKNTDSLGRDIPTDDKNFYCHKCPSGQIPDATGHKCVSS